MRRLERDGALAGEEATEDLGWLWGTWPFLLQGTRYSHAITLLKAEPDPAESTAGLQESPLGLQAQSGKGAEHP